MNIRNILYSLCIIISLASCATSRNTDTHIQSDYSSQLDRLEQAVSSLRSDVSRQTSLVSDRLSNMKVNNTTVVYSPPDSIGRQYPLEVSTTDVNREDKQLTRMEENLSHTVDILSHRVDSLTQTLNSVLSQKQKVTELSWWDRYKTEVLLCVVLLLLVSRFLFRHKPFC